MNFRFKILLLGLVQGLTEFFPISSSGHLALLKNWFKISPPSLILEVSLHLGTLLAVVIVFFSELRKIMLGLMKKDKRIYLLFSYLLVGSIPAALVGFFLHRSIEEFFQNNLAVSWFLIFTGFLLFLTKFLPKGEKNFFSLHQIGIKRAFLIGLAQAVAILPGFSRSGLTLSTGIFLKLEKETAYKFSFLLSLPVTLGAGLLEIPSLFTSSMSSPLLLPPIFLSSLIAFLVGYLSLRYLVHLVKRGKLYYFAYYCWLVGGINLYLFTLVLS
jgi:undecaprenyl-diphosphatase